MYNAIKFTRPDKTVIIEVKDNKDSYNISVIDQGIGISKVNQEKIFNIETKFKTEGTNGEKGTGLGLLICKEFIKKNGSDMYIESQEGKGSTFSFHLPKSRKFVE